jgi:hypothetical protein
MVLALALAVPGAAVAAGSSSESTSGYSQKPEEPKTGSQPSKETSEPAPAKEKEAATTSAAPSSEKEKASTLPFTGFDLRWSVALGVLLMGAGFTIVVVQRRRSSSR